MQTSLIYLCGLLILLPPISLRADSEKPSIADLSTLILNGIPYKLRYTRQSNGTTEFYEYVTFNGKFSFKELSESGELLRMYSFDGLRHYYLQSQGFLEYSRTTEGMDTIVASYTTYHPLFNSFKYTAGKALPIFIEKLPAILAEARSLYERRENGVSKVTGGSGIEFFIDYKNREFVFPQRIEASRGHAKMVWQVESWKEFSLGPVNLRLPAKISYDETMPNGVQSNFSYELSIEKLEFLAETEIAPTLFMVPMSHVNTIVDRDNGIHFRKNDWIRNEMD